MRPLTDRERLVLLARAGLAADLAAVPPQTLETIARICGVTRERIRLIEERALSKVGVDLVATKRAAVRAALEATDGPADEKVYEA